MKAMITTDQNLVFTSSGFLNSLINPLLTMSLNCVNHPTVFRSLSWGTAAVLGVGAISLKVEDSL